MYIVCTCILHDIHDVHDMYSNQFYQGNFVVKQSREGTETRTKAVVAGGEVVVSGLGHHNATCLSGAV